MRREDIENFIIKYNLPYCFGVTKDNNGDYTVVDIDDCESGFYRGKIITKIQYYDDLAIIEPVDKGMCDCIIFDYGNVILSKEETRDGWQPDFVINRYYNFYNLSLNPFD